MDPDSLLRLQTIAALDWIKKGLCVSCITENDIRSRAVEIKSEITEVDRDYWMLRSLMERHERHGEEDS